MANLHIHSIGQQAYTYQIHSTVFTCWISLQIFAFLPSHFLMEVLSLKTSKMGFIVLWHKSAHFPTHPISGNKNTIHWVRNLCLSWLSPSPSPLTPTQLLISVDSASYSVQAHPYSYCLWPACHLLPGGLHSLTLASPSSNLTSLLSPPHHHWS